MLPHIRGDDGVSPGQTIELFHDKRPREARIIIEKRIFHLCVFDFTHPVIVFHRFKLRKEPPESFLQVSHDGAVNDDIFVDFGCIHIEVQDFRLVGEL